MNQLELHWTHTSKELLIFGIPSLFVILLALPVIFIAIVDLVVLIVIETLILLGVLYVRHKKRSVRHLIMSAKAKVRHIKYQTILRY